jgi:peptidoglycan/LPS O-acetylase OafA/YrhL
MPTNVDNLEPKKHFEILDGLRGIAAIAVVIFHFMEWAYSDFSKNLIGHGFLAVDFFFCLSGFVMGYAYDDRIGKMGVWEFLKMRFVRLHPLVVAGSILGLLAFLFDPFGGHPELYSTGKITLAFICSILLIPLPIIADRAFNLFSFNAPAWSLFWEYIANIAYVLVFCKIKNSYLIWITLISGLALCVVANGAGNLLGGWSGSTFWHGGARIAYSFSAGLLIFRSNWIIKNKLGFVGLALLLSFAFMMPFTKLNLFTEPFIVMIYFPLLVALGAGANLKLGLKKVCQFLGKISYPLYMTHYAVLWMFGNYYIINKPNAIQLTFIILAALTLLIGFAYIVMIFYDIPLRKYLSAKLKKKLTN